MWKYLSLQCAQNPFRQGSHPFSWIGQAKIFQWTREAISQGHTITLQKIELEFGFHKSKVNICPTNENSCLPWNATHPYLQLPRQPELKCLTVLCAKQHCNLKNLGGLSKQLVFSRKLPAPEITVRGRPSKLCIF